MTQIWGLLSYGFKIMINMLSALMEKVDIMQEWISNVSTKMETLRNNPKEMPEIKNTVTNEECLHWAYTVDWP